MIKFYEQRGTRSDALQTLLEFDDFNSLCSHLGSKYSFLSCPDGRFDIRYELIPMWIGDRDYTHYVCINGKAVGYVCMDKD